MKTIDKIITPVNTKFGAPMGRSNVAIEGRENLPLYDSRVRLDSDGYDKGGAYWGFNLWHPLRVKYNKSLTHIEFYRK